MVGDLQAVADISNLVVEEHPVCEGKGGDTMLAVVLPTIRGPEIVFLLVTSVEHCGILGMYFCMATHGSLVYT